MFVVFNFTAFIISLVFVLEDPQLAGIQMLINAPNAIAIGLFTALTLYVKMQVQITWIFYVSTDVETNQTYQNIEDRLFMEEYEDPKQTFNISQFNSYKEVARNIEVGKLFAINQNLLRVHRSDSID